MKEHKMTIVQNIFETSDAIQNGRTRQDVLNYTMTEIGELMEEFIISTGKSYKQPGADGIIGEAVDTIICLIDLIRIEDPTLREEDLQEIFCAKLAKWKSQHA